MSDDSGDFVPPGAGRPIVICVDDDDRVLHALARALRRLSTEVEVRATTSARQALAWVTDEPIAVLVSDYEMPEMTGAELAAAARRARPETVRLLLTGQRTYETVVDGINRGEIFRFLGKPFEPNELRVAVMAALARHAELAAITVDRRRRERREALRAALEQEYPGITTVARAPDGTYAIADAPEALAAAFGLHELVG